MDATQTNAVNDLSEETRLHQSIIEVQERLNSMKSDDPVVEMIRWSLARVVSHEHSEQRMRVTHGVRINKHGAQLNEHHEILQGNPKTGAFGMITKVNIIWHTHIWLLATLSAVGGFLLRGLFTP